MTKKRTLKNSYISMYKGLGLCYSFAVALNKGSDFFEKNYLHNLVFYLPLFN